MEWSFDTGGGTVTIRQEENRVCCLARRQLSGDGLYKAWLVGAGGRLLLGTLIPEGGILRLGRTLPLSQLVREGVWPPEGAELRPAESGVSEWLPPPWHRCARRTELLTDPLLTACLGQAQSVFTDRTDGGLRLALPFRPEEPFPLTPLFCLARVEWLGGKLWSVFCFDKNTCPILPKLLK